MMYNPFAVIQSDLNEVKGLLIKLLNKPEKDLSSKLYTIKEASELLKVDKQTIRNHISKGTIRATNFGRSIRIPHNEIFDSLNEIKSLKYKR